MVDVVRCERPSGQAGPMRCIEDGCDRPARKRGRCNRCYQRWYSTDAFELAPARTPPVPLPDPECPWCGPWQPDLNASRDICPTCGLTPGEVRYTERIIADSDAVWREENRAFQAARHTSKGGT